MKSRMSAMVVGLLSLASESMMPTAQKKYGQTTVRHNNYKTGGRPFTRGKRDKSLKVRANRGKAKARAKRR